MVYSRLQEVNVFNCLMHSDLNRVTSCYTEGTLNVVLSVLTYHLDSFNVLFENVIYSENSLGNLIWNSVESLL